MGGADFSNTNTHKLKYDTSTACEKWRKWFIPWLASLLGCEGVQNVGLVLLRPIFLSGHSMSASNIREPETVK